MSDGKAASMDSSFGGWESSSSDSTPWFIPAWPAIGKIPLLNEFDLSSTKFIVSYGAPIGKQVESVVHKRLGLQLKQIYGMTEISPAVNYGEAMR
ncbi:hypothetical protein PsorP6_003277 [Peronosclerospora sorghi]|uniref:Uncharacterized protein n=1 Tax=Peronosclerospora sorghi TaxID=230839 RepID=A0ACC0VMZ7_9STRA|nr:hypothetical protein PsorP6_003277 [Peronosclerospora sorghi]